MAKKKIVLAYSGGLDTSVAIKWLTEQQDYEVVALSLDVGEGKDLGFVKSKALTIGAVESRMVDARDRFAEEFIVPSIFANALYEGVYPLSAALSRPLITQFMVEVAREVGAEAIAHGCTGKGNDQVRFDVSAAALAPDLSVVAPVREWAWSRDEEIAYAKLHGVPVPVTLDSPFSVDANLWGRSCEAGVLEDPWAEAPEEAFEWTTSPQMAPDEPAYADIAFERGVPVALDGERMRLAELIAQLNALAGAHGVGRIDHVENRLVGIKSREVYEAPGAISLIRAHQALEHLTLTREVVQVKPLMEQKYAEAVYNGLWFSPVKRAVDAFLAETQRTVTGTVRLKLFKGSVHAAASASPYSLYNHSLATYAADDRFDHKAAVGFISLWGLPTRLHASVAQENAAAEREKSPQNS